MKKIGLIVKSDARAKKQADKFEKWLQSKNVEVIRKEKFNSRQSVSKAYEHGAPPDLFCVFALGGDGTFLGAVHWIGNNNIPILGVKFGEVGFLAEIAEDKLYSIAETILNNDFTTKSRMRLTATVIRNEKKLVCETALNDIVISKGAAARLIHIKTYINNHYLTTYKADGLIAATPTGSTAYSLAAGGPIIHPDVSCIIMTPICPFTLTNRPLIVPDSVFIKVKLAERFSKIMLTIDGQASIAIHNDDEIIIKKGLHPIDMIVVPNQTYFDVLKAKLRWSGGRV